jgi:thiol-disulfide isomerase/thioredoxin
MSKPSKTRHQAARAGRQQSARERVAAQRAAQQRAERRTRILFAGGSVVLVVAIVAVLVLVKALHHSSPSSSTSSAGGVTGTPLPASVSRQVTGVPATVLNTVGAGSVPDFLAQTGQQHAITTVNGAALSSNGKPEMLYIGAEFCPFCAAMRWSMAVSLSQFGTLSQPLHGIHSSPTDVDPSTPTLTFYKTTYQSKYLAFTPVENETVDRAPLQPVTPQQQAVWTKYGDNSYPFIDVGGKYIVPLLYDPAVLKGMTWSQVAAALHDPSSPVAKSVVGAANYLTAAICKTTGNTPAAVCSAPVIKSLQSKF